MTPSLPPNAVRALWWVREQGSQLRHRNEKGPRKAFVREDTWCLLTAHWTWSTGNTSMINALRRILQQWRTEIEAGTVVVNVGDDWQPNPGHPHHGDESNHQWAIHQADVRPKQRHR